MTLEELNKDERVVKVFGVHEGFARVQMVDGWRFFNANTGELLDKQYKRISGFNGGWYLFEDDTEINFFNPKTQKTPNLSDLLGVKGSGYLEYLMSSDTYKNLFFDVKFLDAHSVRGGWAAVRLPDKKLAGANRPCWTLFNPNTCELIYDVQINVTEINYYFGDDNSVYFGFTRQAPIGTIKQLIQPDTKKAFCEDGTYFSIKSNKDLLENAKARSNNADFE